MGIAELTNALNEDFSAAPLFVYVLIGIIVAIGVGVPALAVMRWRSARRALSEKESLSLIRHAHTMSPTGFLSNPNSPKFVPQWLVQTFSGRPNKLLRRIAQNHTDADADADADARTLFHIAACYHRLCSPLPSDVVTYTSSLYRSTLCRSPRHGGSPYSSTPSTPAGSNTGQQMTMRARTPNRVEAPPSPNRQFLSQMKVGGVMPAPPSPGRDIDV